MFDTFQHLWETFGEALALGLLVSPLAFFWCCCLSCGTCESKKRSILVTFTGAGTWSNWGGCTFESGCCSLYQGNTYEIPIDAYFPYAGFGSTSAICIYVGPGECSQHSIIVEVFTQYANGDYFNTLIRAGVRRNPITNPGCNATFGELNVSAATQNPFNCDVPRTISINTPTPGFGVSAMCTVVGGAAIVESP